MVLGLHLGSLSRRVLSRCRATTAALPLRPSPLGTPEVLPKSPSLTQGGRSFFSGKRPDSFLDAMRPGADGLPVCVNWTRWPAVNPVVNQGLCDMCWVHSTTATVEGLNAIRTNHLVKLSEQQLIDCVKNRDDPFDALKYIVKNGGILAEVDYPYVGRVQSPQNIMAPGVTLDDCVYFTDMDELSLKALVAQQPVTATIGADRRFEDYKGGVINGPNYSLDRMVKKKICHSVTIVGYGELKGLLLWLIKNSWDVDWGVEGFGFIARNTGKRGGAFGIAREIAYPVKVGPNSLFVRSSEEVLSESSEDVSSESSEEDV